MMEMRMQSFLKAAAPFAAMVLVQRCEVGVVTQLTLSKAAMNTGMSNFVYIVYSNALGTLVLLPHFIFRSQRNKQSTRITFALLRRFFLLGLLGKCLVLIFGFAGINYSSPTLAAALGNLTPVFSFLLAIMFRVNKIDIRSSSSNAKSLGTTIAVSGALIMTLYKATMKEYPDKVIIIFFFSLFGTIQCAVFSLVAERNPNAWTLQPGTQMIANVYSAMFGTVHSGVIIWCLHKKGPLYVAMLKPLGMIIAVIMGIMFLGDILHLGSVIGVVIIAIGFYTVMWGQAKEKNRCRKC